MRNGPRSPDAVRTAMPGTVHLHIDRLVLEGVAAQRLDADRLQRVIQDELHRMLAQTPAASWQGGAVPRVDGVSVQLPAELSVTTLGTRVATGVFESVRRVAIPDGGHARERGT